MERHITKVRYAAPTRIAQFGRGNFIRAFAGQMIDAANRQGAYEGGIALIKTTPRGDMEALQRQGGAYTVVLRGLKGGEEVVEYHKVDAINEIINPYTDHDSYSRLSLSEDLLLVISNTTEAGFSLTDKELQSRGEASSFPAKLVQMLQLRYEHFGGDTARGLIIIPLELLEDSGPALKAAVLGLGAAWGLGPGFAKWVEEACIFCSCLVDRIVSGYPEGEAEQLWAKLGYRDEQLVVGEPFGLWVIQSDRLDEVRRALPLDRAGQPVIFTNDLAPYRELKLRLLNGGHTASVFVSLLCGLDTVGEVMEDADTALFIKQAMYHEIAPHIDMPQEEVRAFADSVLERFQNPFIKHRLLSIALNSVAKWRTRILPSLKAFWTSTGELPPCLVLSLAGLLCFYTDTAGGIQAQDEDSVLEFFGANKGLASCELSAQALARADFWGEDLSLVPGMGEAVTLYMDSIQKIGMRQTIRTIQMEYIG